jgi:hypothetical protein
MKHLSVYCDTKCNTLYVRQFRGLEHFRLGICVIDDRSHAIARALRGFSSAPLVSYKYRTIHLPSAFHHRQG